MGTVVRGQQARWVTMGSLCRRVVVDRCLDVRLVLGIGLTVVVGRGSRLAGGYPPVRATAEALVAREARSEAERALTAALGVTAHLLAEEVPAMDSPPPLGTC